MYRFIKVLTGGTFVKYFHKLESNFIQSPNISFLLGFLRIYLFSRKDISVQHLFGDRAVDELIQKAQAVLKEEEVTPNMTREEQVRSLARKAMLSCIPKSFETYLCSQESIQTIRLALLRVFEELQDELICKNMCLHLVDVFISLFFPSIPVWSQLVEEEEVSEEENEGEDENEMS